MTFVIRFFLLSLLALSLISCSYISTPSFLQYQDKRYLSATSVPPVKIPPGLSSDDFDNYYPVSNTYYPGSTKPISLVPPGLNSN